MGDGSNNQYSLTAAFAFELLILPLNCNRTTRYTASERRIKKLAPLPASLSHQISPPIASTNFFTIDKPSPVRFVMDPYEQLHAFNWIESHKLELLGIFHSHPTGPETISATDIAEAAYDVVHVILSCRDGQWQARGFWIEDGAAHEVTLEVTG